MTDPVTRCLTGPAAAVALVVCVVACLLEFRADPGGCLRRLGLVAVWTMAALVVLAALGLAGRLGLLGGCGLWC